MLYRSFQKRINFIPIQLFGMLIIFSCCRPLFLSAQNYQAENISLAQGLSQSTVYCFSQDSSGFLWVGTQDGVNKYDGLKFTTLYYQPFDSMSLTSSNIMSMLHDSNGRAWYGTANHGLNLYLPVKNKFRNNFFTSDSVHSISDNSINVMKEDLSHNIWIGTMNGLNKISIKGTDPEKAEISFSKIYFDPASKGSNIIMAIFPEDNNHLWIGTKNGMYKVTFTNDKQSSSPAIENYKPSESYTGNEIHCITHDVYKNLWAGSSSGIYILDKKKNSFVNIPFSKEKRKKTIYSICSASDGNLWLGTNDGLYIISKEELSQVWERIPEIKRVLPDEKSINGVILSLHEDDINKGIIWTGTEANGMTKISPVSKNFVTNHLYDVLPIAFVFSIYKDVNDIIWIGTTNGLIRFDRTNNKYLLFRSDEKKPNALQSDYVHSIRKNKNGTIWIGTLAGLYKVVDPYSQHPGFHLVPVNTDAPLAPVRSLFLKSDGEMFVALPRKVFKYNLSRNSFEQLISITDKDVPNLNIFIITSFIIDSKENYWLASTAGLFVYRKNWNSGHTFNQPERFFHDIKDTSSLRCHRINDMSEDSQGNVWIATANGLTKASLNNDKIYFTNYSTDNGLKNNSVYTVLENPEDGALWMSTNGGLSKFDPRNNTFLNYDLHDGLQSNEFNGGAYVRADDNEFFFGGVNGYTSFYPKEIISDKVLPKISITDFRLSGNEKNPSQFIDSSKKIELSYNQNSFSIDFIALHYVNPEKNQYAYMLEGYQKEWTYSGTSHQVNFSQLPPGHYVFRVKGSNNDGLYNEAGDFIVIAIHPPFWNTLWFYLLVLVAVFSFMWWIYKYRLKLKMEQVHAIEKIRNDTAADFHDELGHRLTTISWFGEILKKKIDPDEKELRSYLDKIIETSGNLYHTMKDLVWAMDPGKDTLNDLYKQLKEFGESLFDQTGVEFSAAEMNGEYKDVPISLVHKRHLLLIFKEAMHNSFKHSHGNKITLGVLRENNHFSLSLKDNGKGFNFDWNHVGNGLKNVKKRTDLIHGKLFIESGETGTRIELEVPLTNKKNTV